jgi:hypothetical protein
LQLHGGMKSLPLLALSLLGLAACTPPVLSYEYTDPQDDEVLNVPVDPGDPTEGDALQPIGQPIECELKGALIGKPGVEVAIDGEIATVVAWQAKTDAPDQFVGFSLKFSGDVDALAYDIAAGDRTYAGLGLEWNNPDGDAAQPIGFINFCDVDVCLLMPQLPGCLPPPPDCGSGSDPASCPPPT